MSHGAPAPAAAALARPVEDAPRMQLPALAVALTIMVGGTLYPPLMTDAAGRADHGLAVALFWAMSAGFVRGVGFVPRLWAWRWLFSGWAVAAALSLAAVLKTMH